MSHTPTHRLNSFLGRMTLTDNMNALTIPPTSKPPHHWIASHILDAFDADDIVYARLEFPAEFVSLCDYLESEPDDMLAMDFVRGDDGVVVALVTYADYTSDAFHDVTDRGLWTLYDEDGGASFNVMFHDTENVHAWMRENAVLTLMQSETSMDADDDEECSRDDICREFQGLVSEVIVTTM